ncbi:helix-turn-helix transcriptional regulator [Mucilaginibacter sp. PAMB04274]|uniref:response regulator transcription factor n=1 Tax=Mucilaginibacter sp. PAMB04274 TaxID=3138568 RepID=UPI0031F60698
MKAHTQSEHINNCRAQLHVLGVNINKNILRIEDVGDYIPGSIMVQDFGIMANTYMNKNGCDFLRHSSEELRNLGSDYFSRFFPAQEIEILKEDLKHFIALGDYNKSQSVFQRVRPDSDTEYKWYLTTSKLYPIQDQAESPKLIHIAVEANSLSFAGKKLGNLIADDIFVRRNYHLFNLLTAREKEIICLIAKGVSSMVIADTLFLSIHTVNNHRKNIIHKLGITSLSQLVKFAVSFGII